jgi:hypothetical protein
MTQNRELMTIEKYRSISEKYPTSMAKAIRAHCVECSGGMISEVKGCVIPDCSLYPFRMGRRPVSK